tara:strand:+ start:61 stop:981 length:921 start_codon:yes stop_codon:yes gene_type:complete
MAEVTISQGNWDKIIDYAYTAYDLWKTEIGGMAIVYKNKTGDYVVEEPVILKQEVSGGNTVLDKDALAEYYVKSAMKHKDKLDLQFLWWHSHHTMAAFWSSTDLAAIEEFNEGKVSMSLVVNLKQEYKFRINVWEPIEAHEDIDLIIGDNVVSDTRNVNKKLIKETKSLCEKEKTSYVWKNAQLYKPGQHYQGTLFNNTIKSKVKTQTLEEDDVPPILGQTDFYLAKSINKWLEQICDGSINYNQWKYRMNKLTDELIANGLDSYEIVIPTEKELEGMVMHITALDLIRDYDDYADSFADHYNQWR